jgi:two-component system chemotaxis sensor kinase CheA
MSASAKYAELFATESRDHLTAMEHALLELEGDPAARAALDELFRSVHTIKGMSGVMGYDAITSLAHAMESMLARVRSGDEALTPPAIETLFEASDALNKAVDVATSGKESALDVSGLVKRLTGKDARPRRRRSAAAESRGGTAVMVQLEPDTPLPGARAQIVIARLGALAAVQSVAPPPDEMDGDAFDGAFTVRLDTHEDDETLHDAVRSCGFVRSVRIERGGAGAAAGRSKAMTFDDAWSGDVLSAPLQRYVRIDLRRLDHLMNLVGELVIERGRLQSLAAQRDDSVLDDVVGKATRLIGEIQDGVLGSRMVPVWQVFDRFPRVVREAARSLKKEVSLTLQGREIELDRALLEQVADPLVHLLRNAVDHGIEPVAQRRAAGKPDAGHITLSARRERSAVIISVSDDGAGVDRRKVLRKAKATGLLDDDVQQLSDDEVLRVIARAGFSTAERVSEVSGRGVGIDAVVARIRSLGGAVEFRTHEGQGTTFELRLPVTLAIIPALIARVGEEAYALPLTHVTETLQSARGIIRQVRGRAVLVLRDQILPLLDLRAVVGLPARDVEGCQIVIVEATDRRAGLVIDRLLGQHEIVVKSFDAVRGAAAGFNGATILADGTAALILDVGGLLKE